MNILYDKIKLLSLQHRNRIRKIDRGDKGLREEVEEDGDYVHFTEAFLVKQKKRRGSSGTKKSYFAGEEQNFDVLHDY